MKSFRPLPFLLAASVVSLSAADWSQWRGPNRDGHAPTNSFLITTLPKEPKVLWRLSIGGGFSSPVVQHPKVLHGKEFMYLAYLDAQEGREVAHLIDANSSKEIWRTPYAEMFKDEWGPGPRCTPILDGNRIYVQSCKGEFRCLNLADGKIIWGVDFQKDFGVPFIGPSAGNIGASQRRGNNGSGVIDGEHIIVPVGSTNGATLVCFDKRNGKIIWKAGNDETAYSSLVLATLAGVKQIVAFTADSVLGADAASGKILWRVPLKTDAKRHTVTPVIIGNRVIVCSFTIGIVCIEISKEGGGLVAKQAWANKEQRVNLSSPVLVGDSLYTLGPAQGGIAYLCVDAGSGKLNWSQPGFSKTYCATIALGTNLLTLTDLGELVFIAADSKKFTQLGRIQVCGNTWSHPAYVDGKLFVREGLENNWKLTCFDLTSESSTH